MNVQISMATTPERAHHALEVARQLRPQCDSLVVYVNGALKGCDQYPGEWLEAPEGDIAVAGKFYRCPGRGYHLTVDDDLHYPPTYVRDMVKAAERHPGCVVSLHGSRLRPKMDSYYDQKETFRVLSDVNEDTQVHCPGTGCMIYHTHRLPALLEWEDFIPPYMADLRMGIICATADVPCWVAAHRRGYITHRDINLSQTIWSRFANGNDVIQTWYANRQRWPQL